VTELFGRSWGLTVGTLDCSGFDIKFRVEKTLKPEPNKCVIEVFNLSPEHRAQLAEQVPGKTSVKKARAKAKKQKTSMPLLGTIPVRLEAGYGEDVDLLFFGDLRTCDTETVDADFVTTMTTGDGDKAFKTSRVSLAVGPKTPLDVVLAAVLKTLGLGMGNLSTVVQKLQGGSVTLPRGAVLAGPTARVLTDLCRSADIEWFIEDGVPTFVNLNKSLSGSAVKLSAKTGLIGSPSVDSQGLMKCRSLIIPGLRCGRILVLDSMQVKGNYRIEKVTYEGESGGDSWYCDIEGTRY
jgi:hypothetical protein